MVGTMPPNPKAKELIQQLGLKPLPVEGGYFRETYRSNDLLHIAGLPARYSTAKFAASAIYYLLTDEPDCFSAMHRLPTDELYHFYLGDPVEMLLLHADGNGERVLLGTDMLGLQRVQHVVRRGVWQGSQLVSGGSFALLGATMAPGFDPSDFAPGRREELIRDFPGHADMIRQLTRPG
jgi:predicted cupin superfamily sugar epimerase